MPCRRLVLAALAFVAVAAIAPADAIALTSPAQFLGHAVGADRKLADYPQILRYFETLDRESDRVALQHLGRTTLGRDMIMAIVSSPANLQNLDAIKHAARALADPRGLSPQARQKAIDEGKVVLLVGCNIHSSEIASSQMAMEWAHQLAGSDDPGVRRWLDDVVLLLIPSLNPDGTDMIVDYYRKYVGTPWEGGRLPWLYHHYAGHDNNRDWFMLNLPETRYVNRVLHHEWFPQVFLDEHQMGTNSPRIFVPPYADPMTPLVHPLQWRLVDLFGTNMALRLEQQGKSGVIDSYAYDAYWPGGTKNTACLKNVIGLLTEMASARIATPVEIDKGELAGARKGLPEYIRQMNFPNPWPGGVWRLRDIVDYELIASNSLLETCSNYRAELLRGMSEMAGDAVRRGGGEAPYAYVIPAAQRDPAAAAQTVAILRENGLEAKVAEQAFELPGYGSVAPGSVVFLAAQPYRGFLVEMMERQRYPEVRQGPDTKEIHKPYDVTAWTLPLLTGVEWVRADKPFAASLSAWRDGTWPVARVEGEAPAYRIRAGSDDAARAVNRLLARGASVSRVSASGAGAAGDWRPGDFIVRGVRRDALAGALDSLRVEVAAIPGAAPVTTAPMKAPRLGIYKSWAASMDEGWTRLVLDRHGFTYTPLDNAAMKQKNLRAKFDVLILPDQSRAVIVDGKPKSEEGPSYFEPLPPPYDGGIGKDGVENLKAFVQAGGTLVCLTGACELPLEDFGLPVRNLAARLKPADFAVPGTMLNVELDTDHPLAWGMPEKCVAYSTGGPVFATSVPGANVGRAVVGRYPEFADQIVASGWADGTEYLAGRAAVVEARLGAGRVVLFGPRVQLRGQTVGTYKLLFNAIWLGASGE